MRSRFKLAAVIAATSAMAATGAGTASAGTTPAAKLTTIRPAVSATPGAHHSGLPIHRPTAAQRATPNQDEFVTPVRSGVGSNMCLDVYHGGTANYTNVDIYQCNNTVAQSWTFVPVYFNGNIVYAYRIMTDVASNMCLDDYHSQINNYNNVDIYQCNGTNAQIWYVYGNSLETAADPSFGTCLDVYHGGTGNFTNVDVFQCNSTAAQNWYY